MFLSHDFSQQSHGEISTMATIFTSQVGDSHGGYMGTKAENKWGNWGPYKWPYK